jgi:hypothetical protein
MSKSEKTRQIVALSAGVAVGLSASAIVLLQGPGTSNDRLTSIQSALRDGAVTATVTPDTAPRIRIAKSD